MKLSLMVCQIKSLWGGTLGQQGAEGMSPTFEGIRKGTQTQGLMSSFYITAIPHAYMASVLEVKDSFHR